MKLLFITHNSHRAGAPKVLLLFLQWLKEHTKHQIDLIDLSPGGLHESFKEVCDHYYTINNKKPVGILEKIALKTGLFSVKNLMDKLKVASYDLIYANTVKSIPYGTALKKIMPTAKLLVHVHELPTTINLLIPEFSKYVRYIDKVIAVSGLVKNELINTFNFLEGSISLVYEFSDKILDIEKRVFSENDNIFYIGASGSVDWRKGADIFLQVARTLFKQLPHAKIKFIWVGKISQKARLILENDILKLGLKDKVQFVGEKADPYPYYKNFDVFLMTSREDPFPLVCIEMGQMGIPIICFEKAVGTAEVITKGGGKIVPYLDAEAMANMVVSYFENTELRKSHADQAKQFFGEFTVLNQAPLLYNIIKEVTQ